MNPFAKIKFISIMVYNILYASFRQRITFKCEIIYITILFQTLTTLFSSKNRLRMIYYLSRSHNYLSTLQMCAFTKIEKFEFSLTAQARLPDCEQLKRLSRLTTIKNDL